MQGRDMHGYMEKVPALPRRFSRGEVEVLRIFFLAWSGLSILLLRWRFGVVIAGWGSLSTLKRK